MYWAAVRTGRRIGCFISSGHTRLINCSSKDSTTEKNKQIINFVMKKSPMETHKFLEALSRTYQQHVVNYILYAAGTMQFNTLQRGIMSHSFTYVWCMMWAICAHRWSYSHCYCLLYKSVLFTFSQLVRIGHVPRSNHKTIGDRAFPVAAAKVWNSLPPWITSLSSLLRIRKGLKTDLFRQSYGDDHTAMIAAGHYFLILTWHQISYKLGFLS